MQILRCAKNSQPVSNSFAFGLYLLMEIQIFSLFIIKENSTIFGNIVNFLNYESSINQLVVIIFVLNLVQTVYFIGIIINAQIKQSQKKNSPRSNFLRLIQLKPYLFYVVLSQINVNALKSESSSNQFLAVLNILFMTIELIPINIVNTSYRFIEKNFIRKKSNSILHWFLIILIIFTNNFYGTLYGAIFLIIRALIIMYDNFNNLQNQQLRKCQWLFPLISLKLAFLLIVHEYFQVQFFNNFIVLSFIILFTVYSSDSLSQRLLLEVLKYHFNASKQIFDLQKQASLQFTTQKVQMTQSQLSRALLQLRIMVKIYQIRLKSQTSTNDSKIQCQNFDNFWMNFDRLVLDHKVNCINVACKCNRLKPRSSENWSLQNEVVSNKIYELILKIKQQSLKNSKLIIIENYFLIELLNNPLKTYYQLMKIEKDQLNREETLQVENLIHETRDNFKQLFLRQKVQNTDLDIEPLFQFQDHLKDMRSRLNEMAVEYRQFYEIFANNFVQMQTLKQKTRRLTEFKRLFSEEIELCLRQFDKSLELMTFCMVYFRFFDQYTNRLEKVEERAQYLVETFKNPVSEIKRGSVDIFDPHYGAVKADLVFNPGKTISITKSMCSLLGYTHQQLSGQKINKLMPLIFSKYHDRFISNFIEKGKMKILRHKQKIFYARNKNKFIIPITIRLKVDYSSSQGMYAVAFTKLSETKSEFILMNNYGKVQEITAGIYSKIFGKALGEENRKVKRLCVGKFLLSFNFIIKQITQTDDKVYQGLLMSSDSQDIIMDYYKFPQFAKVYKGKTQNGQTSSRSVRSAGSVQQTHSSTDGSISIDLSDDIAKYSVDLKEALRIYFKNLDHRKLTGYRVSYRCQDYVTNQFKCKILEIVSVRQELTGTNLVQTLKQEIIDVGQFIGLEERQIVTFKIFNEENVQIQDSIKQQLKITIDVGQLLTNQSQVQQITKDKTLQFIDAMQAGSEASSSLLSKQTTKKKQIITNSFRQRPIVNSTLQTSMTFLILLLAFILIIVCVFSIQLQSNYQDIQHDNLVLTNYRIDFLLLFGIQQLGLMYKSYNVPAPKFVEEKKSLFVDKMKEQLIKLSTWISISQEEYKAVIQFKYEDIKYHEQRTMLAIMKQLYTIFVAAPQQGHYIADNYVIISEYLLGLTSSEQILIIDASQNYTSQIHIIIACYSFVLLIVIVIGIWFRKIALEKQDKVIDFLPFLKPYHAKKNEFFFQQFYEINKQAQQINIQSVQQIAQQVLAQNPLSKHLYFNQTNQKRFKNTNKKQILIENNSRLIRVVKNQKSGITFKIVMFCLLTFLLCLFVIFYSQFFFASADSKFDTYLDLKNSAFLIQLIPCRIIALYFSNINRMLHNQTLYIFPESFYKITHDRIFELQYGLSKQEYHGTEMEQIISDHFNRQICSMIECSQDPNQTDLIKDQQVFYLAYRFVNSFSYMRKIINMLPNMTNPREQTKKWMIEDNVLELLQTTEHLLDLMKRSESTITDLFTNQINQIGSILLSLSLTLIPILILVLQFSRKKYIQFVIQRFQSTEHIFRHLSWTMLSENNYAINYFDSKIKNLKQN